MKAVQPGFGRTPSILKIYFLESPIPDPAPPLLSVTKSITWRYLGNQACQYDCKKVLNKKENVNNGQQWSTMVKNGQNGLNDLKWSKMVQEGPK